MVRLPVPVSVLIVPSPTLTPSLKLLLVVPVTVTVVPFSELALVRRTPWPKFAVPLIASVPAVACTEEAETTVPPVGAFKVTLPVERVRDALFNRTPADMPLSPVTLNTPSPPRVAPSRLTPYAVDPMVVPATVTLDPVKVFALP
jgi:hypothetical protein